MSTFSYSSFTSGCQPVWLQVHWPTSLWCFGLRGYSYIYGIFSCISFTLVTSIMRGCSCINFTFVTSVMRGLKIASFTFGCTNCVASATWVSLSVISSGGFGCVSSTSDYQPVQRQACQLRFWLYSCVASAMSVLLSIISLCGFSRISFIFHTFLCDCSCISVIFGYKHHVWFQLYQLHFGYQHHVWLPLHQLWCHLRFCNSWVLWITAGACTTTIFEAAAA